MSKEKKVVHPSWDIQYFDEKDNLLRTDYGDCIKNHETWEVTRM